MAFFSFHSLSVFQGYSSFTPNLSFLWRLSSLHLALLPVTGNFPCLVCIIGMWTTGRHWSLWSTGSKKKNGKSFLKHLPLLCGTEDYQISNSRAQIVLSDHSQVPVPWILCSSKTFSCETIFFPVITKHTRGRAQPTAGS